MSHGRGAQARLSSVFWWTQGALRAARVSGSLLAEDVVVMLLEPEAGGLCSGALGADAAGLG